MDRNQKNDQGCITQAQIDAAESIRALCWKNPFAVAMLAGKIETRKRPTKVRGLVLIVSTMERYSDQALKQMQGSELYFSMQKALIGNQTLAHYNGYAIAIGELVDCRPMTATPEDEAATFVKYEPERWCWIFKNVTRIMPIKLKGFQGWRFVPKEIIKQITPN